MTDMEIGEQPRGGWAAEVFTDIETLVSNEELHHSDSDEFRMRQLDPDEVAAAQHIFESHSLPSPKVVRLTEYISFTTIALNGSVYDGARSAMIEVDDGQLEITYSFLLSFAGKLVVDKAIIPSEMELPIRPIDDKTKDQARKDLYGINATDLTQMIELSHVLEGEPSQQEQNAITELITFLKN